MSATEEEEWWCRNNTRWHTVQADMKSRRAGNEKEASKHFVNEAHNR